MKKLFYSTDKRVIDQYVAGHLGYEDNSISDRRCADNVPLHGRGGRGERGDDQEQDRSNDGGRRHLEVHGHA